MRFARRKRLDREHRCCRSMPSIDSPIEGETEVGRWKPASPGNRQVRRRRARRSRRGSQPAHRRDDDDRRQPRPRASSAGSGLKKAVKQPAPPTSVSGAVAFDRRRPARRPSATASPPRSRRAQSQIVLGIDPDSRPASRPESLARTFGRRASPRRRRGAGRRARGRARRVRPAPDEGAPELRSPRARGRRRCALAALAWPWIDAAAPACVAAKPQLCVLRAARLRRARWDEAVIGAHRRCRPARAGRIGKRGDVPVRAGVYAQALTGRTPSRRSAPSRASESTRSEPTRRAGAGCARAQLIRSRPRGRGGRVSCLVPAPRTPARPTWMDLPLRIRRARSWAAPRNARRRHRPGGHCRPRRRRAPSPAPTAPGTSPACAS